MLKEICIVTDLHCVSDVNTKKSSPSLSPSTNKVTGQIQLWFSVSMNIPVVPVVELNTEFTRSKGFALAVTIIPKH